MAFEEGVRISVFASSDASVMGISWLTLMETWEFATQTSLSLEGLQLPHPSQDCACKLPALRSSPSFLRLSIGHPLNLTAIRPSIGNWRRWHCSVEPFGHWQLCRHRTRVTLKS